MLNFELVRFSILFLCLLIGFQATGQDTCKLSVISSNGANYKEYETTIINFINNRDVEGVDIIALISIDGEVSNNRLAAEGKVLMLRNILLNFEIPMNRINAKLILFDTVSKSNELLVTFKFGAKKGDRVLKKTSVVQISEVELFKPRPMPIVIRKEEIKVETLLDETKFKKNETINLPNLIFEPGTHFILASSESVLVELLAIMKRKPRLRIELQGHICCQYGGIDVMDPNTGTFNLSEMRAKTVYNFLVENGVSKERMTYKGFGSSRKIYPQDFGNVTAAAYNRRVEVLILEAD